MTKKKAENVETVNRCNNEILYQKWFHIKLDISFYVIFEI